MLVRVDGTRACLRFLTFHPRAGMSGYRSSGGAASDLWVQIFSCCVTAPARKRAARGRVRIDRSMIGEPTNFQHTGHIGSGDVDMGNSHLQAIQNQMQSKGGYETAYSNHVRAY